MVVSTFQKYIFKDFKNLFTKLISIIVIVTLGVTFLVGILTSAPNMRYSMERYYDTYNMADLVIQTKTPFSEAMIDELKNQPEIETVMPYLMIDEKIEIYQNDYVARILLLDFKEGIKLNQLSLVEGRLPNVNSTNIEVVVERTQMYLIDIPIGYQTEVLGKTFEVVGIVQNPWYFAYVQEIAPISQRPIEAMLYADQTFLDETTYSHVAVKLHGADDFDMFSNKYKDFVDAKVISLENTFEDYFFTSRNQNQSFVKYQSDIKIVEAIALIFPWFFFLITALVSMSSVTRIINDQRMQIGTLRSLGYNKFRIMWKYLLYAIVSSAIGSVLGIALGVYFIPAVIYNAFMASYNLPIFAIRYSFLYTSIISLTMILSVVLVTLFSVGNTLKERPTELLQHKAPKPGKKIILERIPFIWNKMKFKYKSTFRNIFRHKRNLLLTVIGIAGSTALLLAGFGIKDSVDFAGSFQFDDMLNYDMEVGVSANETDIAIIDEFDKLTVMVDTVQYENKDYINVIIPNDSNKINEFFNFKNPKRESIKMNNDSVMVTKQFAVKHNILIGNNIKLSFKNKDYTFVVTDIVDYYFGNNMYISKDLINSTFDYTLNHIYIKSNLSDSELKVLKTELKADSNVVRVLLKEDIKDSYVKTSESMNSIIIVLVLSASGLSIVINYNLTLININSRQREIATLKVLGYREREVSGYVFRETMFISIFAILLGVLLGNSLHYLIISQIVVDGILLSNQINWLSYLLTVILSYVFLFLVYFISLPKMRKINMIDSLKSFE